MSFSCPYDEDELRDTSGGKLLYPRWRLTLVGKDRLRAIAGDLGQSVNRTMIDLIVADLLGVRSFADRAILRWCPRAVPCRDSQTVSFCWSTNLDEAIRLRRHGLGVAMNCYLDGLVTRAYELSRQFERELAAAASGV